MNSEIQDFFEVTGMTPDGVRQLRRDNPTADKILASVDWQDEITAHESVLMRIDAVKDQIESGERLPARQLQETLRHLESMLQSRVKSLASHTTAKYPPARSFIVDAGWSIEHRMYDNVIEGLRGPVLDYLLHSLSKAIADSEGLELEEARTQIAKANEIGDHAETVHDLNTDDMALAEIVTVLALHLEENMNRSN